MKAVSILFPKSTIRIAMDNFRLVLLFSLAFVLLLIYQAWMKDYGGQGQPPAEQTSTVQSTPAQQSGADGQETSIPAADLTPDVPAMQAVSPVDEVSMETVSAEAVEVETDYFLAKISTKGGTITSIKLKKYPLSAERTDLPFQLFKDTTPNLYLAQSGILSNDKESSPNHKAVFRAEQSSYKLAEGQDKLQVNLVWTGETGVQVTKTYTFSRSSYVIGLTQSLNNKSGEALAARSYTQLQRSDYIDPNESSFIHTYTGAAIYSPEKKYEKISFDDIASEKFQRDIVGGWLAMLQHYFVGAWVPDKNQNYTYYSSYLNGPRYIIGAYSPVVSVAPGSQFDFTDTLWIGPKLQYDLAEVAEGLDLTVDYGWLTILAQPIFWLLDQLYQLVGNWGFAIILLTIIIKLVFYKLSETSYKSMANMRKLTPRLQALKDRYGDDKERLNQAMMEMYKKEKINPLGGCLPILVQIPVFIALYWVLLESVEMRQAPFIFWLDNLSAPDPYFILPLVMGLSMFIQQKLNPAPVDPLQQKMMMSLPFVFTIFFAFFPSGLVLYWVVNNILSIAQQWYITQNIEKAAKKS